MQETRQEHSGCNLASVHHGLSFIASVLVFLLLAFGQHTVVDGILLDIPVEKDISDIKVTRKQELLVSCFLDPLTCCELVPESQFKISAFLRHVKDCFTTPCFFGSLLLI